MLRLGIVDFDSSHSIEFTRRFNHVGVPPEQYVEGARVVAGWPGDSDMAPERIPGFTTEIEACGVDVVDTLDDLVSEVDAILILSLSGSAHLGRVEALIDSGLPMFVDKPFTCSAADAAAILELAESTETLIWSSSGLRFADEVVQLQNDLQRVGPLHGLLSYGPAWRNEGNPGYFHYAIHPIEQALTCMGPDWEWVSAATSPGADIVTAGWHDGRMATIRLSRSGATAYGLVAFAEQGVLPRSVSTRSVYRNLCREIVNAFETGAPPVSLADTVSLVRFLEGALLSEQSGGRRIRRDTLSWDSDREFP